MTHFISALHWEHNSSPNDLQLAHTGGKTTSANAPARYRTF
jgi:hypothetical protein